MCLESIVYTNKLSVYFKKKNLLMKETQIVFNQFLPGLLMNNDVQIVSIFERKLSDPNCKDRLFILYKLTS